MGSFINHVIGSTGVIAIFGLIFFIIGLRHANSIFNWIESQTFGTRNYVLDKLTLLFIEIPSEKITWVVLALSIIPAVLVFGLFAIYNHFIIGIIFTVIVALIGQRLPKPIVNFLVARRVKQYHAQMVDALQLLSNGIRAGMSMLQSIGMIVDEMMPPISQEFGLVLQQNRIGVPIEECLDNLAKRVPLEDNQMFVTAINILKESGGNLAEIFDTIVVVIRERIRLQQKIDTFTAQNRTQGIIIFLMPFVLGIIFTLNDPASMEKVFRSPIGLLMVGAALFLQFLGGALIWKILNIKL